MFHFGTNLTEKGWTLVWTASFPFSLNTFLNLTAQMLTDKYLGESSGVVLRHTKCVFD